MRNLERIAFVVLLAVAVFGTWYFTRPADAAITAAVDTVRITDARRDTIRDTVKVYIEKVAVAKHETDSLANVVTVLEPGTLALKMTPSAAVETVIVPAAITDRIQAQERTIAVQDSLIGWDARRSAADSLAIIARDKLIGLLKPPRKWGVGLALGPGCGRAGCEPLMVVAGVTYRP